MVRRREIVSRYQRARPRQGPGLGHSGLAAASQAYLHGDEDLWLMQKMCVLQSAQGRCIRSGKLHRSTGSGATKGFLVQK